MDGHGQMRRTEGVGNGHYWGLRHAVCLGIWRLQSRGPGTVSDCQQTREAAMDKDRSCKQLRANKLRLEYHQEVRSMIHPSAALGGGQAAADPQAWSNYNLSLSQLAALAEGRSFWYSETETRIRRLVLRARAKTQISSACPPDITLLPTPSHNLDNIKRLRLQSTTTTTAYYYYNKNINRLPTPPRTVTTDTTPSNNHQPRSATYCVTQAAISPS
jgi:hypothetical protein